MSEERRISERIKAQLDLLNTSAAFKACFCDKETGQLTRHGARVLRNLAKFAGLNRSPLRVGTVSRQVDTHATCTAIGRQETVQRIFSYIHLDPTTHPLMKDEDQ